MNSDRHSKFMHERMVAAHDTKNMLPYLLWDDNYGPRIEQAILNEMRLCNLSKEGPTVPEEQRRQVTVVRKDPLDNLWNLGPSRCPLLVFYVEPQQAGTGWLRGFFGWEQEFFIRSSACILDLNLPVKFSGRQPCPRVFPLSSDQVLFVPKVYVFRGTPYSRFAKYSKDASMWCDVLMLPANEQMVKGAAGGSEDAIKLATRQLVTATQIAHETQHDMVILVPAGPGSYHKREGFDTCLASTVLPRVRCEATVDIEVACRSKADFETYDTWVNCVEDEEDATVPE